MKMRIFEGLNITNPYVARELAIYWKYADQQNTPVARINNRGDLIGKKFHWARPLARENAKILLDSLWQEKNDIVEITEEGVTVDFSKLCYNPNWVRQIIRKGHLGAKDSPEGLRLYEPAANINGEYFKEVYWPLKNVRVSDLGDTTECGVKISPLSNENPEVEYAKLSFGI